VGAGAFDVEPQGRFEVLQGLVEPAAQAGSASAFKMAFERGYGSST
jgi:hypothetical protein